MELRHLRYFVAVAHARSFTAAARKLGIHQPPLSQQVRDLEREVGYPLFDRLRRGVALTAGGSVFLEEAESILARVDDAVRRAGQAAQGTAGSLAIGFTSSALVHRLTPLLIARYRGGHPGVEVTVGEGNAAALSESVAAGRLDAAFIRRQVTGRSGLGYVVLGEEPMLAALPMAHPVAEKARRAGKDRIRLADLANDPFILVRRPGASGMYGDLIEACHAKGFAPRVVAEVSQMFTNVTMVAAGFGVSVVPASMRDFHADAVFYASIADAPQLKAPFTLVTPIGRANPTLDRFVAFAREVAAASARRPRAGELLQP